MAEGAEILICHYGGGFVVNEDSTLNYKGGDAKAFSVSANSAVDEIKSELSLEMQCDPSCLKLKYFLPGDTKTPLNIVIDRDIQRMIEFHLDAKVIHIYVIREDIADIDMSLVIDRQIQTVVGDSTSTAGPMTVGYVKRETSSGDPVEEKKPKTLPSGSIVQPLPLISADIKPLPVFSWDKAIVGVGQEFRNAKEFRSALGKFALACGFNFHFIKNNSNRVTAECKDSSCSWRIHASRLSKKAIFKIKKYEGMHTCGYEKADGSWPPHVLKHWVVEMVKEKLTDSPDSTPRDIIHDLQREYGVQLTYRQVWRGMEVVRRASEEPPVREYDGLPRLCRKIMETNPGSEAMLITTSDSRFSGLFVCFSASRVGFNEGCRPVLLLKGICLKGRHRETVISAISVDANDGMFPVAFGVVGDENDANWIWFLNEVKRVVRPDRRITFISNMSDEVTAAVAEVFPDECHALCINNLCECFGREVKAGFSVEVKDYLIRHIFQAACATNVHDFEKEIGEIRRISGDAFDWICRSRPERWSNAFFQGDRYDNMSSEAASEFEIWLDAASDLPLSELLFQVACRMRELMDARRLEANKWETRLTPSNEARLEADVLRAHSMQVISSQSGGYEVCDDMVLRGVDLGSWTCACRWWEFRGRPCAHAIAVIEHMGQNVYDYCSPYLTTEIYRLTYANPISPIPDDQSDIEHGEVTPVNPPLFKRRPGRPRKPGSEPRSIRCSRCGETKHNKLTCKVEQQSIPCIYLMPASS